MPNICKIEIKCDENPVFLLADLGDGWISGTTKVLIVN